MARRRRRGERSDPVTHEGFLRHARFRWLKVAVAISLAAIGGYILIDAHPRPRGGSAYGYLLGTVAALLIVWLTLLGVRKRAITSGQWSLKAWVSAHVYLGVALVVIATLHTGFQFGWNVHTLAYALMLVVVASGVFGVVVYAALPRLLSENRAETTERQMLENIRSLDRQLHEAAQPLDQAHAAAVRLSLEHSLIGGGYWRRLTGGDRDCGTRRAIAMLASARLATPVGGAAALNQISTLLDQKAVLLLQARNHVRIRAWLAVWLNVHVPATFALLAALTAHIISVFFYW